MEWIKLSERKPKDMTSLWVSDGHTSTEAFCWSDGVIESAYDTFDTLENMKEITHFIELPDKPKEDK